MCADWFAPFGSGKRSWIKGWSVFDLGDMRRYGCKKSPDWDSDVESWTESEGTSSEQCEHIVESLALNAMGQDQPG